MGIDFVKNKEMRKILEGQIKNFSKEKMVKPSNVFQQPVINPVLFPQQFFQATNYENSLSLYEGECVFEDKDMPTIQFPQPSNIKLRVKNVGDCLTWIVIRNQDGTRLVQGAGGLQGADVEFTVNGAKSLTLGCHRGFDATSCRFYYGISDGIDPPWDPPVPPFTSKPLEHQQSCATDWLGETVVERLSIGKATHKVRVRNTGDCPHCSVDTGNKSK